jgi:hypothetical protein
MEVRSLLERVGDVVCDEEQRALGCVEVYISQTVRKHCCSWDLMSTDFGNKEDVSTVEMDETYSAAALPMDRPEDVQRIMTMLQYYYRGQGTFNIS